MQRHYVLIQGTKRAAIILTGGQEPDQETIEKAEEDGIPILIWPQTAFELAGQAYAAGITNS